VLVAVVILWRLRARARPRESPPCRPRRHEGYIRRRSLDLWAGVCSLMPRPPGNQAKLQDAAPAEGQDDDRSQNYCEEQRDGQRQLTVEDQEVELDALQVLQDEDQDHRQGHYADHKRGPSSAEARLALACVRFSGAQYPERAACPRLLHCQAGHWRKSSVVRKDSGTRANRPLTKSGRFERRSHLDLG
jgi:hypothetical protein